jgi:hypothetical protein
MASRSRVGIVVGRGGSRGSLALTALLTSKCHTWEPRSTIVDGWSATGICANGDHSRVVGYAEVEAPDPLRRADEPIQNHAPTDLS